MHNGPRIVKDGLILHLDAANTKSYPFTGITWTDLTSYKNDATLINSTTYSTDNDGTFIFDGINDRISTSAINLSSTNKITISFFCKVLTHAEISGTSYVLFEMSSNFNSSITGAIIGYSDDSNGSFGKTYPITIALRGNNGYNISGFNKLLINDLKWHYWTCIFDKSVTGTFPQETRLFIDSIEQTPTIVPNNYRYDNTNNFGSNSIHIGQRTGNIAPSNAQIGNFLIYDHVLTQKEILQNFNALKSRYGL